MSSENNLPTFRLNALVIIRAKVKEVRTNVVMMQVQDGAKRDRMRRRKGETGRGEVEGNDREKRNIGKGEGGKKFHCTSIWHCMLIVF